MLTLELEKQYRVLFGESKQVRVSLWPGTADIPWERGA